MTYSNDLRERVIAAVQDSKQTLEDIAETFQVSQSTVEKWVARWRMTGSVAALPWAGGKPRVLRECETAIRAEVRRQPDISLDELCARVATATGVVASASMMCRELQLLQLPIKKNLHDSQRDTPRVTQARAVFEAMTEEFLWPILHRLKFLDESGVQIGMTRLYGRAAPGERVNESTPDHSGTHYTVVAALSLTGISAPWMFEGAMTALAFRTYVEHVLGPTLAPGDVVILDNLSAHKDAATRALIEASGAHLVFLPPYSSDFNPIELCWATVKQALRAAKARTWETLLDAVRDALQAIQPDQAEGWFAHCGYEAA